MTQDFRAAIQMARTPQISTITHSPNVRKCINERVTYMHFLFYYRPLHQALSFRF